MVIAVCLGALAITGTILLIAGIQKNQQSTDLRQHGVPVTVTVTSCVGLMGGTGAQGAGYSCTGSYAVDGTQYRQAIPGFTFHQVGTTIEGIAVPGDPKLLSTPDQVASQHSSWKVFIVPALLLLVAATAGVVVAARRRSASPVRSGTGPAESR